MKFTLWRDYYPGEKTTAGVVEMDRQETEIFFLGYDESHQCIKRDGIQWRSTTRDSSILRPSVDRWLRQEFGSPIGETRPVDRIYYPDEPPPPKLPEVSSGWFTGQFTPRPDIFGGVWQISGGRGSIVFRKKKDATRFMTNWTYACHEVVVTSIDHIEHDMRQWLFENVGNRVDNFGEFLSPELPIWHTKRGASFYRFYFSDPDHAMLFKLTWAGR